MLARLAETPCSETEHTPNIHIVTRVRRDSGSKVNYYVHISGLHPQSNENVLERSWKHCSVNGGQRGTPARVRNRISACSSTSTSVNIVLAISVAEDYIGAMDAIVESCC